jgi:endo-1,4-beta-xylanase
VPSSNNNLASIKVQGYVLSPVFDTKVTEYVVWLPYETESVSVTATPADYKASVRIEGGKELIAGADNEIKVICAAEDGTEKVYTVIAKRAAAHGSTEPTVPETTEAPETTVPETSKAPETTQAPETTAPAAPSEPGNAGGIQTWVLIVACVAFLVLGAVAGIIVDKKLLNK